MNAKIYVSGIGNTPFKVQRVQSWNLFCFIFTKSLVAETNKITQTNKTFRRLPEGQVVNLFFHKTLNIPLSNSSQFLTIINNIVLCIYIWSHYFITEGLLEMGLVGESILTFLSLLIHTGKLLSRKDVLLYEPSLMHTLYWMLLDVYNWIPG